MTILSLGAGSCNTEIMIANSNPDIEVIALDSFIDPGKDKKFSFDYKGGYPDNFKLLNIDYNSDSFLDTLEKFKNSVDIILMNFPHSNELYFPNLYDNKSKNEKLLKDIYELLNNGGKFLLTTERTDNVISRNQFTKHYKIHESYIPKAANFDYIKIYSEINNNLKLFNEKIELDILDKINISGEEFELFSKKGVSYNLFKELYEIKTLILIKNK